MIRALILCAALAVLVPVPPDGVLMAALFTAALFAGTALAGTFAASALAFTLNVIVGSVASFALSKVTAALSGKPKGADVRPFGVNVSLRTGGEVPRSFMLGTGVTAGSLVWANTWRLGGDTPNEYLTQVIALSDLPSGGVQAMFVDGEPVTFDTGTLNANSHDNGLGVPVIQYRDRGLDYMFVKVYTGGQTAADPFLTGVASSVERPWESTRVGRGVTYAIVTFRHNPRVYAGPPQLRFQVVGAPLYNPTLDTTAGGDGAHRWDDPATWVSSTVESRSNPAVQLYALHRGIRYDNGLVSGAGGQWVAGLQGVSVSQLPSAQWRAAIAACAAAGFEAGGEVSFDTELGDVVEALLASCQGRLADNAGTSYALRIGEPGSAVAIFSDDDIITTAEQSFTPFPGLADTINGVIFSYPRPSQAWQVTQAPPIYDAALEAEDGGRRLPVTIAMPMVYDDEQAQRLAKAALAEARRARRHTITLPPRFWALEPGDVVAWTSERNGYDAKLFRVDGLVDLPGLDVLVDLTEVDPADYDWDSETDFTPVADGFLVPARPPVQSTSVTVEAWTVTDGLNARRPAIRINWTNAPSDAVGLEWQVRLATGGVFVGEGRAAVEGGSSSRTIVSQGIVPATNYEVRGLWVPGTQRVVDWSAWLAVTTPDVRLTSADLGAGIVGIGNLTQDAIDLIGGEGAAVTAAAEAARDAALAAQADAEDAADAAANSATGAAGSASAASGSAASASDSAAAALVSKTAAEGAAGTATTAANTATTQASAATASAAAALVSQQVAARVGTGGSVIDDPLFGTALTTFSLGWYRWSPAQGTVTTAAQTGGKAVTVTVGAGQQDGIVVSSVGARWVGPPDVDALAFDVDLELLSGALDGAGVLVNWVTAGPVSNVRSMAFSAAKASHSGGGRTRYQGIIRKPTSLPGAVTQVQVLIVAGWGPFGTIAAKSLRVSQFLARVATAEELGTGEVGAAIATAVSAEATARTEALADETEARTIAITAAKSEILGGSTRTLAQVDTDQQTKVTAAQADARADTRIAASLQSGGSVKTVIDAGDAAIRGGSVETLASIDSKVLARVTASEAQAIALDQITAELQTGGDIRVLIDAKGVVIYSTTAPATAAERQPQNLWIDTGGSPARNRPHRWNGSAWVAVSDADIAAAQAEAASKGKVIYAATAPTATADRQTQNLWIDTGGSPARNDPYRWNGSAWVKIEPAALTTAKADITTLQATKVDASGAVAAVSAAISAESGGALASVQELTSAQTTLEGDARALRYLTVAANGRVASQLMGATDNGSVISFDADRFEIWNGSDGVAPFVLEGGVLYIDSARIKNAAIDTLKLAGQAVTLEKIQQNAHASSVAFGIGVVPAIPVPTVLINLPYTVGSRGAVVTVHLLVVQPAQVVPAGERSITFQVKALYNSVATTTRNYKYTPPMNFDGTNYSLSAAEVTIPLAGLIGTGGAGSNVMQLSALFSNFSLSGIEMWLSVVNN